MPAAMASAQQQVKPQVGRVTKPSSSGDWFIPQVTIVFK
jgi:hypothetical protein